VKLSVFQNRRWDSDLKTVRQVLLDGVLGDIVEANSILIATILLVPSNTKKRLMLELVF
jgi:hypothetical protein